MADEAVIESMLELVPSKTLKGVEFVWVRETPSDPPSTSLVLSFRVDTAAHRRLGAIVRDGDAMVVELYASTILSSLTDDWLQIEWGIAPRGVPLSRTERFEIVLFSLMLHLSIRSGFGEEAHELIRRIGRVIFRAAVRNVVKDLKAVYPDFEPDDGAHPSATRSAPGAAPISAQEVVETDFEELLRKLLGL